MPISIKIPNVDTTEIYSRLNELGIQVNSLTSGVIFKGEFSTYLDMVSSVSNPLSGYWTFITEDETHDNLRTQYIYYDNDWLYAGGVTSVNDATNSVKGIVRLNGDLSGNAMYPELSNVGMVAGSYNLGNGAIATFDNKGRCLSINVTGTTEWEFNSLANTRNSNITQITVPNYDIVNSQIFVFWSGNLLNPNRDYNKTNATTISFNFTVKQDEDLYICNIRFTGSLDKSVIINDSVASRDTCFSSEKSNNTYARLDNDIIPNTDDIYSLGNALNRFSDVYVASGVISTSDKRLKENIKETDLSLDFINKLKPVSFTFKGKKRKHYGFISQDIKEITNGDFGGYIYNKEADLNLLRMDEFLAPMVASIQELSKQIDYIKLPFYQKIILWFKGKFGKN